MIGKLVVLHNKIMIYLLEYIKLGTYIDGCNNGKLYNYIFNRHLQMDHRIFGKDVTNILDQEHPKGRRNCSFLHNERPKDLSLQAHSRSISQHQSQPQPKLPELHRNPQMVPEYFNENLLFMR